MKNISAERRRTVSAVTTAFASRCTAPPHGHAWPCSARTSTSLRRSSTTAPVPRWHQRRTVEKGWDGRGNTVDAATKVGELVASRAKDAGVNTVVFDRGGNLYHGRVAALADAAREAGLEF